MTSIIDEGVLSHRKERAAFIPTITSLSDGSFIAGQQVGTELSSRDHSIELLHSSDGRKWQSNGFLEVDQSDVFLSYHSVQVYEISPWLWMMRASRNHRKDLEGSGVQIPPECPPAGPIVLWSRDRGRSWSGPGFIDVDLPRDEYTYHSMGNVIFFSEDHWMFPIQVNNPKGYTGANHHGAAAVFTHDAGASWGEFSIVAQDPTGRVEYHDQFGIRLPNGHVYTMLWTVDTEANADLNNRFVISKDDGRSWSAPEATNLRGQVCAPVLLKDGRVAAIYNDRHEPQGIRLAVSENLQDFTIAEDDYIFTAGTETMVGNPRDDHFLSKNAKVAFGRPNGICLADGTLLVCYWCTVNGITHTRWARVVICD